MDIVSIPMEEGLDPVFARFGQKVYTYEYIEKLREENLRLKSSGKPVFNLIPQKGMQEDITMMDSDFIIAGSVRGVGKVLPDDADIITPKGIVKNGELKVGDTISDPCTGKDETVLEIFEHRDHDFYELQFTDGTKAECGLEHLWKVRISGKKKWRIMSMEQIIKWFADQKNGMYKDKGRNRYLQIPVTEPVEFTKYEPSDIDTYVIGATLGDGCVSSSVRKSYSCQFSNSEPEIRERFERAGIDMSHKAKNENRGDTYYIKDERLTAILDREGLSGCKSEDKFIPERYRYARLEDRINLIQGLMDTDGYVDSRGLITYSTVSRRLSEDVRFVLESLGCTVTTSIKNAGYRKNGEYHKCKDSYELYIRTNNKDMLFSLSRKKGRLKPYNGGISTVSRRIMGYRYAGKKNGRCISVSGEGRLYLTNDFIVTHNTWLALFLALTYYDNPQATLYAFRKTEDDIKRGPWESSKHVFTGFATPIESSYEWKFPSGARFKMEQLYNAGKTLEDRFRGAEQPYMMVEELQEHTVENMNLIFKLIGSNRNTIGVPNRFIGTCNPKGKSNSLRHFIDWYIDPETDTVIPERDGKKRYFYRYGNTLKEIAWGNSKEEVYADLNARKKLDRACKMTGENPMNLITSLIFIQGSFRDNKVLQVSDKSYMAKLMSQGEETVDRDVFGIWRDSDEGTNAVVSVRRVLDMFDAPSYNTNGIRRASADVALSGDFLVLMAFDGWHLIDVFAKSGIQSDTVVPIIRDFLKRNGVREDRFTYDSNGLGLWLKGHFKTAKPFNNKARSAEPEIYANLKTECAYRWGVNARDGRYTIDPSLADMKFVRKGGDRFSFRDILVSESRAVRMKEEDQQRYEIIPKSDMKKIVGHSPDFIECFFMVENIDMTRKEFSRRGFGAY